MGEWAGRSTVRNVVGECAVRSAVRKVGGGKAAAERCEKVGVSVGGGVSVRASTIGPGAGRGLFANMDFDGGDYVTEYTGTRLWDHDTANLMARQEHMVSLGKGGVILDGLKEPEVGCVKTRSRQTFEWKQPV